VSQAIAEQPMPERSPAEFLPLLLSALDVERQDAVRFVGRTEALRTGTRLFGGLIAAQSLRAAQRTVRADLAAHSLHCYFIREGRDGQPVDLRVDRLRDGRSFDTRQVTARQDGRPIFTMTASFHRSEPGADRGRPMPSGIPHPARAQHHRTPLDDYPPRQPFDVIELADLSAPESAGDTGRRAWFRAAGPVPDDAGLHACLLTYISDFATSFAAVRAIGVDPRAAMVASLDHALWFHRPARLDDWVHVDVQALSNSGNRGLTVGTMHSVDGTHIASLTQEALVRPETA